MCLWGQQQVVHATQGYSHFFLSRMQVGVKHKLCIFKGKKMAMSRGQDREWQHCCPFHSTYYLNSGSPASLMYNTFWGAEFC